MTAFSDVQWPNNKNCTFQRKYLMRKHSTKIVTAGCQDNPMNWKLTTVDEQRHITECV